MRYLPFLLFLFCLSFGTIYAQKTLKHTVQSGESFYSIAKKYKVSESEIYELNPKVKGTVLQLKTVLRIPNKNNKKENIVTKQSGTAQYYVVERGDSFYKISKKVNISIEKLETLNPDKTTTNLKIGDKIKVVEEETAVVSAENQVVETLSEKKIDEMQVDCFDELGNKIHIVQKGETLFKIAKKYKIKLIDLKDLNEEVVEYLPEGYHLIIKIGTVELANLPANIENNVDAEPLSLENVTKADFLIAKASKFIGTRYRGGGTTSAGFDCSGLVFTTYKNLDITLPRSSGSMAVGAGIRVDRNQAQKGDLIFFTTNGRGNINHVGMVTEVLENEIKFIHSSVQAGVIISSTKDPYYAKRFVQVNRVLTD